jgi:hypothetical protein
LLKIIFLRLPCTFGFNFVLTRTAHYAACPMKSSLRFVLLFALIILGRLAKQPVSAVAAKAPQEAPVQNASFFARQITAEPTPPGSGSRLWQATAPNTRTNVSLE